MASTEDNTNKTAMKTMFMEYRICLSDILGKICREKEDVIPPAKEEHGVVGRAREHVGSNGTLRSNVLEIGYKLEQVQDFLLFSFKLPLDERHTMQNSRFTKAIECLVQYGISDQIASKKKKDTILYRKLIIMKIAKRMI